MFEYSNIHILFVYSNTISEFEYSHFLSVSALCLLSFQMKSYRPVMKGGYISR